MKKLIVGLAIVLAALAAPSAHAQAASVTLSATASTTPGVSGYNVLRAPCTGTVTGTAVANGGINNGTCSQVGAFGLTPINSTLLTSPAYVDTTASNGVSYVYELVTVCPAAGCSTGVTGSTVSSPVAVTLPSVGPLPVTNFTGVVQ